MHAGAYDQGGAGVFGARSPDRPLAERPDVLSFATAPLEGEIEVTGPVTVRLWIASDAPDTDFTAKLIDVYPPSRDYPPGFAMNLCEGLLRLRYRDSWERPSRLTPGEVYAIAIELFPIGNCSPAGTAFVSTFRAATSRISTSTRIRASPKARWSSRGSLPTASLSIANGPRTSSCRHPVTLPDRQARCGDPTGCYSRPHGGGGAGVMRGRILSLAAILVVAGSGWAGLQAAGSGNPRNDRLLALPPARQAQALGNSFHRGCIGVSAFPMGVTATGKAKGTAYWSVGCKNGKSYVVQIPPSAKGAAVVADCRVLQGSGRECLKKF